jgi:hypothetical protein
LFNNEREITRVNCTKKYQTLTNLASSDVDACVEAGRLLVADLYDPKDSAKSVHRDLNKLRVKLLT